MRADDSAERDAVGRGPRYRTVWRWHFYAGLFCIPFVVWLSITGSMYLFKPEIDAWLDRPYEGLVLGGPRAEPRAHVAAALAAVPGSVLNAYELPATPRSAVRVLVGRGPDLVRVYVHPSTSAVLHVVREDDRPSRVLFYLHGELLAGDRGSMVVELAASWAIVMLLTGLYLWWPRDRRGLAGVLYPRLERGGRVRWRDLHAVSGVWVSAFALFLLASGMPWAKAWGGLLKDLRAHGATVAWLDWSTGRSSDLAQRVAQNTPRALGRTPAEALEHAAHMEQSGMHGATMMMPHVDYAPLDRIVPAVTPLGMAPPVLIAPPSAASASWTARSDAQNRPLRETAVLSTDGGIVTRQPFAGRPWIDRAIAYGVAAHEGQLFGWLNRALELFTAASLVLVSVSAVVLWWRRRPDGALGAPRPGAVPRRSLALGVTIIALAVVLPMFGASMLVVLLAERLVLRRIPAAREFLGLRAPAVSGAA